MGIKKMHHMQSALMSRPMKMRQVIKLYHKLNDIQAKIVTCGKNEDVYKKGLEKNLSKNYKLYTSLSNELKDEILVEETEASPTNILYKEGEH